MQAEDVDADYGVSGGIADGEGCFADLIAVVVVMVFGDFGGQAFVFGSGRQAVVGIVTSAYRERKR